MPACAGPTRSTAWRRERHGRTATSRPPADERATLGASLERHGAERARRLVAPRGRAPRRPRRHGVPREGVLGDAARPLSRTSGKIYLLVRSGDGRHQRGALLDATSRRARRSSRCARRTATGSRPSCARRSSPIDGDVGAPLCGLDEALVRELRGTIDAVVNVAGVVDFNPPLDEALDANAFGAQNLVALARALERRRGARAAAAHEHLLRRPARRKGPIVEEDPREIPFPRAGELGARRCGTPSARSPSASTSSRRRSTAPTTPSARASSRRRRSKNLAARGEPDARRRARRASSREVKRKFVSERARRGGHRPRDPLGLAEHLHVHEEHRRAGHRPLRARRSPSSRPACCESTRRVPVRRLERGHQHRGAAHLPHHEGAGADPARRRAARLHPDRLRRARG